MSTGPDEDEKLLAAAEAIASRQRVDWQRLRQECDGPAIEGLQAIEKLLPFFATAAAQLPLQRSGSVLPGEHRHEMAKPQAVPVPSPDVQPAVEEIMPAQKPDRVLPLFAAGVVLMAVLILLGVAFDPIHLR